MISEIIRKQIINLVWRGYGSLAIVKEFNPGTAGEERELSDAASTIRSEIETLVRDLRGGIVEAALRKGFGEKEVLDGILSNSDLVPRWDAEVLISGVAAKLDEENRPAREAAEKAASEARRTAIQKQIDDARASLRAIGINLDEPKND